MAEPGTALMTLSGDGGTLHCDPSATAHLKATRASAAYFAVPPQHAENRDGVVSTVVKVADGGQRSIVFVVKRAIGATKSSAESDLLTRSVHELPATYFDQLRAEVADTIPETAAAFSAPPAPPSQGLPVFDPMRYVLRLARSDDRPTEASTAEAVIASTPEPAAAEAASSRPGASLHAGVSGVGAASPSVADMAVAAALAFPDGDEDDPEVPAHNDGTAKPNGVDDAVLAPESGAEAIVEDAVPGDGDGAALARDEAALTPGAQLAAAEEELRRLQADSNAKKQVVKDWIAAFQAEQGRPPTTEDKRAIRAQFDDYAAASAKKKAAELRLADLRDATV